jgi:hypothetical protein
MGTRGEYCVERASVHGTYKGVCSKKCLAFAVDLRLSSCAGEGCGLEVLIVNSGWLDFGFWLLF